MGTLKTSRKENRACPLQTLPVHYSPLSGIAKTVKQGYNLTMSDFLFVRPSILEGIGRNIDLFGVMNLYNLSEGDAEADARAFAADASALKNDFDSILSNLNVEQK